MPLSVEGGNKVRQVIRFYTIFFDNRIQRNDHSGTERIVQRIVTTPHGDDHLSVRGSHGCGIPLNHFNIDQIMHIQYPGEWESQGNFCELKYIFRDSNLSEWTRIQRLIHATLPNASISSIHRIQNQHLWRRYFMERQFVKQKNGGVSNEIEMFHGTRNTNPEVIFRGEEGFDMRYSNQGRWGVGIYFASDASYSVHYAYRNHEGKLQLLLSRVISGCAYACISGDQNLRTPPAKNTTSMCDSPSVVSVSASRNNFFTDFYDSVLGMSRSTQICTVYNNSKAYPSYLITLDP